MERQIIKETNFRQIKILPTLAFYNYPTTVL